MPQLSHSFIQKHSCALGWGVPSRFALLFLPVLLAGAILPENIGPYHKVSVAAIAPEPAAVWREYGLLGAEHGDYTTGKGRLAVDAYRFQDSTGALAAWQWKRPESARAAGPTMQDLTKLASSTPSVIAVALGNHLLILDGYLPTPEELANVFRSLPHQQSGPLPTLPDHLPAANLVPNSERYISGPASLALFSPEIDAATAAFHLGTEAQLAAFRTNSGEVLRLAIFSFPTLDSARDRASALQSTPSLVVKRSGFLVAVVFSPKDLNAAESLLSLVRYQAVVTGQDASSRPPSKKENWGNFMVNLFILVGFILVFCLLSGVVFGGMFAIFRRGGESGEGDSMISLHLNKR